MNNDKVILLKGDVYFIKNWLELDLLMKANFPIWPNPWHEYKAVGNWGTPLTHDLVRFKNTYAETGYVYKINNYDLVGK